MEEVLYHYTSLEVLQSILEEKTIRLSDITKSNDSSEITLIKEYILDVFCQAYRAEKTNVFRKNVDQKLWDSVVRKMIDKWFDLQKCKYSYYVLCFSSERDLLSQWRGYANDAQGVAIGFDRKALETTM